MFGLNLWQYLLLILSFILFTIIIRKILKFIKGLLTMAFISIVFPIFLKFIGIEIKLEIKTFVFFLGLGIGLYLIYGYLKTLWTFSKWISKIFERKR